MAKVLNRLSARGVEAIKTIGLHPDGGGLYLSTKNGGRRWVFIFRWNGKRKDMGLGSARDVSLARARQLAEEARAALAAGVNPIDSRKRERSAARATQLTFGVFSETYIASVEAGWKNEVHRQQWRNSLRDHAKALKNMPIGEIDTDDVLAVLRPVWLDKPETASRVRGRIEKILDAAKVLGHRPRDSMNPAAWRGHLALLLPKQPKLTRGNHAALPFVDAPAFMQLLRQRPALSARCLEFTILTAARSGEALGATWGEIDLAKATWTVPAERMKAGVEHVVPLSEPATKLLKAIQPTNAAPSSKVFAVGGAARSNMAMSMLLRRMGRQDITVHGFRSTFRDWAGDATDFPREVVEAALAHTIQNKAERAYRRGSAIEKRRALMIAWADYLMPTHVESEADV